MAYQLDLVCSSCGSRSISPRYSDPNGKGNVLDNTTGSHEPMDSEEYLVHYDTYHCKGCKKWDFIDSFTV